MIAGEQRINELLRDYWQRLRKGRPFPSDADIDPDAIGDIWGSCFMVKASSPEAKEHGYRYEYLGTDLIEAFGGDITNEEVSSRLINPQSPPLQRHFDDVARTGMPVEDEAEFTNRQGRVIKYRSCMVPIGKSPSGVDYIIGAVKWKAY